MSAGFIGATRGSSDNRSTPDGISIPHDETKSVRDWVRERDGQDAVVMECDIDANTYVTHQRFEELTLRIFRPR